MEIPSYFSLEENDPETRRKLEEYTTEPDWALVFFKRPPQGQIENFLQYLKKKFSEVQPNPFFYFLKGVATEFGINTPVDLELALKSYREGAERRDSYCHYRLYFIQRKHSKEFNLVRDRDQEMMHLLKASAYFDYFSDERYKFYPVYQYAVHLDLEDYEVIKSHKIIEKFRLMEPEKQMEYEFLDIWTYTRFYITQDEQKRAVQKLKILADKDQNNPEAAFLLAELYSGHIENLEIDLELAERYYLKCCERNLLKAYTALASLNEKKGKYKEAVISYSKAAKAGCFRACYELGSFLISGEYIEQNFKKGIKFFIRGFWLGYMYSADHLVLLMTNKMYNVKELTSMQDKRECFEISESLFHNNKFLNTSFLKYGPQYYLLALCYEKGIYTRQDKVKALELLSKGEEDQDVKEKKYIFYRIARIFEAQQDMKKASSYYSRSFELYSQLMENQKLVKYPAQYYRMGKFYENGWGVKRNYILSEDYYKKGSKPYKYFFLLQFHYNKKCLKKAEEIKKYLQFPTHILEGHSEAINDVIVINSNQIATASRDCSLRFWNVKNNSLMKAIENAHDSPIIKLNYIKANKILLSLDKGNCVKIWSLTGTPLSYRCLKTIRISKPSRGDNTDHILQFIPITPKVLACSTHSEGLFLYNFFTEKVLASSPYKVSIHSLHYQAESSLIFSGDSNGELAVWKLSDLSLDFVRKIKIDDSYINYITSFKDASNHCRIITGSMKSNIAIINPENLSLEMKVHTDFGAITSIIFVEALDKFFITSENKNLYVIKKDKLKSKEVSEKYEGHKGIVKKALWMEKMHVLVTASYDKVVRKWEIMK